MANLLILPGPSGVFVLISLSLAVCVGVIIVTMITTVVSIVNHIISWLSHPIWCVGVLKLSPLCPALSIAAVTNTVTVTTAIMAA